MTVASNFVVGHALLQIQQTKRLKQHCVLNIAVEITLMAS